MDFAKLLLDTFDEQASLYSLLIVKAPWQLDPAEHEFAGIHFIDTASLLSLDQAEGQTSFDIETELEESSETVSFSSFEIGEWCRDLLKGTAASVWIAYATPLYQNIDFAPFAKIAKECLSKKTVRQFLKLITYKGQDPSIAYYLALEALAIVRTHSVIPELSALLDLEPTLVTNFSTTMDETRFAKAKMWSDVESIEALVLKELEESDLQDEPGKDILPRLNEELLRLRRAIF